MSSSWDVIQKAFEAITSVRYEEVVQNAIAKTDDPDLYDIDELESSIDSIVLEKAPGHDGLSLKVIKEVFFYHSQWLLPLYKHCLGESQFRLMEACSRCQLSEEGKGQEGPRNLPSYLSTSSTVCGGSKFHEGVLPAFYS